MTGSPDGQGDGFVAGPAAERDPVPDLPTREDALDLLKWWSGLPQARRRWAARRFRTEGGAHVDADHAEACEACVRAEDGICALWDIAIILNALADDGERDDDVITTAKRVMVRVVETWDSEASAAAPPPAPAADDTGERAGGTRPEDYGSLKPRVVAMLDAGQSVTDIVRLTNANRSYVYRLKKGRRPGR